MHDLYEILEKLEVRVRGLAPDKLSRKPNVVTTGLTITSYLQCLQVPDQEVEWETALVPIKDWLSKQPHLPNDVEDILLRRFYLSCGQSLERVKKTMDFFFTIRSNTPELFMKRDPWAPEIRRVFEIADMCPLPHKTKENYRVFLYALNNPDYDLFNFVDAIKTFFMLADTRLTEEDDIPSGEIPIFDTKNITLKFIGKINLAILRKYMLYTQDAIPIRLKQVHIINAPGYISKIYALCKPFLNAEVAKLVKFHEPGSDTLYKDVPRDLLPNEYGGKAGSVEQIKRYWTKRVEAKRDWFLANDKNWAVNEALRPSAENDDKTRKVQDLPGSFRNLCFD